MHLQRKWRTAQAKSVMNQLSRQNLSRQTKVRPLNFYQKKIQLQTNKKKIRPELEQQTLGYKGNDATSKPSGKAPTICKGSIKRQAENVKEKMFTGKSLVPD